MKVLPTPARNFCNSPMEGTRPSAYANSKKGDDGTSVRLVFLTTNATERHYLRPMSNLIPRSKCCATAAIVLLLHGIGPGADSVRYNPVAREVVEARLRRYGGDNRQREATLKKMFAEAGCDDQHVSAQAVKGSRLANVICLLPGSSDKSSL
jgi:hypothetical protein